MSEAYVKIVFKFLLVLAILALFTKLSIDGMLLGAVALFLWESKDFEGFFRC